VAEFLKACEEALLESEGASRRDAQANAARVLVDARRMLEAKESQLSHVRGNLQCETVTQFHLVGRRKLGLARPGVGHTN